MIGLVGDVECAVGGERQTGGVAQLRLDRRTAVAGEAGLFAAGNGAERSIRRQSAYPRGADIDRLGNVETAVRRQGHGRNAVPVAFLVAPGNRSDRAVAIDPSNAI